MNTYLTVNSDAFWEIKNTKDGGKRIEKIRVDKEFLTDEDKHFTNELF